MRLLSTTRYSVKTRSSSSLLRPPAVSSINPCLSQHVARLSLQPSLASFRRTFASSSRLFQRPTPRTDHDREAEEKTKPSIGKKLQVEKIWTIPNVLTISRIISCPVLGYAILHDNFYAATGLLVYAALTDFVRVRLPCFPEVAHSFHPFMHLGRRLLGTEVQYGLGSRFGP